METKVKLNKTLEYSIPADEKFGGTENSTVIRYHSNDDEFGECVCLDFSDFKDEPNDDPDDGLFYFSMEEFETVMMVLQSVLTYSRQQKTNRSNAEDSNEFNSITSIRSGLQIQEGSDEGLGR